MTLINHIKNNKNARLIFGKKELGIIEKQLLGLELTNSEQTRLSRDIRKKLQEIKELAKYEEEFKLKKAQEIKIIIEESKEIILNKLHKKVNEIILFGSYAKGNPSINSDIDLVLKLKQINNPATKIRAQLSGELDEKVDIQIYSSLPKKIQLEINKFGKILYKNE